MLKEEHTVFVAELATGELAGWIGTFIFRSVELDSCAVMSGLIVDENYRSRDWIYSCECGWSMGLMNGGGTI